MNSVTGMKCMMGHGVFNKIPNDPRIPLNSSIEPRLRIFVPILSEKAHHPPERAGFCSVPSGRVTSKPRKESKTGSDLLAPVQCFLCFVSHNNLVSNSQMAFMNIMDLC